MKVNTPQTYVYLEKWIENKKWFVYQTDNREED